MDFHPGGDIHPLCLYGLGQPVEWKGEAKETFGFPTQATPPHVKELEELQDELADMVANLKFKEAPIRNKLQD